MVRLVWSGLVSLQDDSSCLCKLALAQAVTDHCLSHEAGLVCQSIHTACCHEGMKQTACSGIPPEIDSGAAGLAAPPDCTPSQQSASSADQSAAAPHSAAAGCMHSPGLALKGSYSRPVPQHMTATVSCPGVPLFPCRGSHYDCPPAKPFLVSAGLLAGCK